jgi:hypothetical protein
VKITPDNGRGKGVKTNGRHKESRCKEESYKENNKESYCKEEEITLL